MVMRIGAQLHMAPPGLQRLLQPGLCVCSLAGQATLSACSLAAPKSPESNTLGSEGASQSRYLPMVSEQAASPRSPHPLRTARPTCVHLYIVLSLEKEAGLTFGPIDLPRLMSLGFTQTA